MQTQNCAKSRLPQLAEIIDILSEILWVFDFSKGKVFTILKSLFKQYTQRMHVSPKLVLAHVSSRDTRKSNIFFEIFYWSISFFFYPGVYVICYETLLIIDNWNAENKVCTLPFQVDFVVFPITFFTMFCLLVSFGSNLM